MKDLLLPVRLEFLILSLNPGLRHRCVALPVDQGEALGDKPHMRSGGLGGARCELNGRRPQSPAQHRGVDPVDAVLCQQFGERPRSCVCASFFSARCTSNRTEEGLPARSEIVPPVAIRWTRWAPRRQPSRRPGRGLASASGAAIPRLPRGSGRRRASPHLVLDSTGLSIVGAGEWAAAKHGGCGRRGWRKLHLGVDQSGVIRVHTLTEAMGDDATTALDLLNAVDGPLVRVTADAAYDTVAVYETARARGATVVIPPVRTANVSGHGLRSPAQDRTITLVKQLGRRQ